MNPEPRLHPTSVPTRRKPVPRGRFRERVGLGCVPSYPISGVRTLITCFGAPLVLDFRTNATDGPFACSWRCHLRHDGSRAAEEQIVTVHRDPNCDCCSGWVQHLQQAGFSVKTIETTDLKPVKTRLGVPNDLAACHTAQIGGYVIEGHVHGRGRACMISLRKSPAFGRG
jgi:hypothetical protein